MEMNELPESDPLHENSTNAKSRPKKHRRAWKYFLQLMSESSVTGVSQIITVRNIVRRIFKILVLGACLGGFTYQTVQFVKLYTTYPTQLEIELSSSGDVPLPSITICNRNLVQKSKYCKDFPRECAKPTNLTLFCNKYPRHCNQDTSLDDLEFVINDATIENKEMHIRQKYEQNITDFIPDCCFTLYQIDEHCQESARPVIYSNEESLKQKCYVIDFTGVEERIALATILRFIGIEDKFTCSWLSPYANEEKFSVVVDLDPKEYTRPGKSVAAQAYVHSQNSFKNPFENGFLVKEGKRYTVSIVAFEEYLLPAPYSTNCSEKEELPKDYNREICIRNCTTVKTVEKCGCVLDFFPSESEATLCEGFQENFQCMQKRDESKIDEFCRQHCPRPCYSSYIQYTVTEADIENNIENIDLGDGATYNVSLGEYENIGNYINNVRKGKAVIDLVYDTREVTAYKYSPKYEKIEILGYVGGFIGIWLGISLVAVFDFIESIIVFIYWLASSGKKKRTDR